MRQIKFRGKDLNTGEWVYGFYSQGSCIDPISGEEGVRHIIKGDVLYDVDPETVCQFTGLLDMYEKEVYEGDIVMHDGNHELGQRIVAFYDQTFGIFIKDEYDDIRKGQNPWLNDYARPTCMNEWSVDGLLKVVGNVYDDDIIPELKERYAWKPSDEQIKYLQESIGIVGELTPRGECLKELAEQLKKLREE